MSASLDGPALDSADELAAGAAAASRDVEAEADAEVEASAAGAAASSALGLAAGGRCDSWMGAEPALRVSCKDPTGEVRTGTRGS